MDDFYIVAIGCSAGGTAAYNEMFSILTSDINAAFVVIQHLHPEFETINYKLLAGYTSMKTFKAKHGEILQRGCIYFIPENVMMTIKGIQLQLRPRRKDEVLNRAVNIFFTSLASEARSRAIGIILSGFGNDGAEGALAIHEAGGIVMSQAPRYALYKGMPQSLISRHYPHFVLPPDELASKLKELVSKPLA
jgi:two-component system CheB/CheR fusion protein